MIPSVEQTFVYENESVAFPFKTLDLVGFSAISRDETTGEVLLRILSDDIPAENAKSVSPTLEDYYLYVFADIVSST